MKTESVSNARQLNEGEMLALINSHAASGAAGGQHKTPPARLTLWWKRFIERRQMRRDLEGFTDAVLEDFGLTRQEATAAANKPFWRA